MRSAHRLPPRLVRWTSLSVCLALVLSVLSNTLVQSASNKHRIPLAPARSQSQNGRSKKADPEPPQPGPPAANLPNLDELRHRPQVEPSAAAPQESTIRTRRKPSESRRGRTVIDGPPPRMQKAARRNVARNIGRAETTVHSHHARRLAEPAMAAPLPQGGLTNLALNKPATQSSDPGWGGPPSHAVDGNTDGIYWNGSVTATNADAQAWWRVDLGSLQSIQNVEIWNRTDCCADRLANFNVILLDNNQNVVSSVNFPGQAGTQSNVSIVGTARYVKVQLGGTNYLSLAEVKVWGTQGGNGPYGGTPTSVPGTIEVENYDEGGAEVAYHDTTAGSHGQDYDQPGYPVPSFRQPTDVDIYKSAGYNNGYLILPQAGDWMKYTVSVAQTGAYTLQAKTWYWSAPGGTFHIECDGVDVTGAMQIPGSASEWDYVTRTVSLTAGQHVLRLVCDTNGSGGYTGDIDDLKFIGTADQFVQTAHQASLSRSPQANEASYWADITRAASTQGAGSLALGMRELGMTLFESAAYAGRNRDNHQYVHDLYQGYLMREPDPGGWAFWESAIGSMGREGVRRAFDGSTEFSRLTSALTSSGAPSSAVSSLATATVDPFNQPGNQLRARDCEWSLPLVSLPGRAGLDLGLSLSYSSLVWTRSGPYLYFDGDRGSPSPGFRLGFPTIQGPSFDAQLGKNVYLLITPSGRVELRQLGASNTYESFDSSYLQMTAGSSLTLRTTDGTQMSYLPFEDEWHCTSVEDRNGNVISVNYNNDDITLITDTLNRVINFNYDTNSHLTSITQSWGGQSQPHPWATFGWEPSVTVTPSFSGASVVGTSASEQIPMVRSVSLGDSSSYKFQYNSNGQVGEIDRYAAPTDTSPRTTLTYLYNGATDDCPRLSASRIAAENWTGINGVPGYVETDYLLEGNVHTVGIAGDPNGTVYKEVYGAGWQKGLVTHTEVWGRKDPNHAVERQKQTDTTYTQDNPNANYQTNPRAIATDIYDSGNHNHTAIGYQTFTLPTGSNCSLPINIDEYAADQTTILRRTHTDYNLNANFLNRHIIGLPDQKLLYEGLSTLRAKSSFAYDWAGEYLQPVAGAPTQHDANYATDFVFGRGNLVSVQRWDVNYPNDSSKVTENRIAYDIDGNVVFTRDALNHQNSISYSDSFSDGNQGRHTYAYPTVITDADGFSSYVQYNFDFGAKTSSEGPAPGQQAHGLIQNLYYDSAARLVRVATWNNGAYTRYIYGSDYVASYSTVNNSADEAYSITYLDGVGRDLAAVSLRAGGGFNIQFSYRDLLGRVNLESNPTQTDSSGVPTGDDAAGWVFTQQTYDWKGRPLETTNTDGTVKQASYDGCGCAGGEVVTLTDEVGRQQRVYSDMFGRTARTEVLNLDGTVYATTVNTYNARDQLTLMRQYQGNDQRGVYQDTTMSYDGYGRLQNKHLPEQNAGANTVYAYNSDGTVHTVTDARGASATYAYNNNRGLVSHISYDPPGGVPDTPDVSFEYDALGNRTLMTDGLGSKSYSYNQVSQLMSETRNLNGVGTFALNYDYNLAGALKKITDATGMTINYGFDNSGRLNGVTGSDTLYAGVSSYASNFQYRAWGGLKAMTDGTNHTSSLSYNSKLQPSHFDVSGGVVSQNYDYFDDGRISFVHNTTDARFDRSYAYDHAGRLSKARSGGRARGDSGEFPYDETFTYDPLSNLTGRASDTWDGGAHLADTSSYANNRRADWGYDADGRNTSIDTRSYTFDAAGQMANMTGQQWLFNHYTTVSQTSGLDGDGQKLQEVANGVTTYYLTSSVLGGAIIEEMSSSGQKNVGYVYAGGQLLAKQSANQVTWKHPTPAGTSEYLTFNDNSTSGRNEFDPLGADLALQYTPPPENPESDGDIGAGHFGGIMDARWSDFFNLSSGCTINGTSAATCSEAITLVNSGAAEQCTNNECTKYTSVRGQLALKIFHTHSDGYSGYELAGSTYRGDGRVVNQEFDKAFDLDPQNPGVIVPLTSKAQGHFDKAQEKLLKQLGKMKDSSKCAQFLARANISLSMLQKAVSKMTVFDGPHSTLSNGEAGVMDLEDSHFKELPADIQAKALSYSVASNFSDRGVGAVTSLTTGSVFFNPKGINQSNIFHEALHVISMKGDEGLAHDLKISFSGGSREASLAINAALKANGCPQ